MLKPETPGHHHCISIMGLSEHMSREEIRVDESSTTDTLRSKSAKDDEREDRVEPEKHATSLQNAKSILN
ncbi:hypothetical protein V6N13_093926 [Hibiscus sabdariffa]